MSYHDSRAVSESFQGYNSDGESDVSEHEPMSEDDAVENEQRGQFYQQYGHEYIRNQGGDSGDDADGSNNLHCITVDDEQHQFSEEEQTEQEDDPDEDEAENQEEEEEEGVDDYVTVLYSGSQDSPLLRYVLIPYSLQTTIEKIKQDLSRYWDIPTEYQHLKLGENELANDKTINYYSNELQRHIYLTLHSSLPSKSTTVSIQDEQQDVEIHHGVQMYGPGAYMTNYDIKRRNNFTDDYQISDSRPRSGLVGLKNQGATCYLNSLIQVLYMTPEFRKIVFNFVLPYDKLLSAPVSATSDQQPEESVDPQKDIIFQMQLLFARLQFSNVSSVSTQGLTTSFGWDNSDVFVQHDVQELNRVLIDNLEEKMKGKVKSDELSIDKLYKGVMVNRIKCTKCGHSSNREEDFYDISLVIKDKKTIVESLESFTELEILKDENAYNCEVCQSKQAAEKGIMFKSMPEILNIQLKRFEFNWNTNQRVKLNDEISFPQVLDTRPYIVDVKQISDSVDNNNNNNNDDATLTESNRNNPDMFDLYAILVHSGSAGFGHYYAFIKNFTDGKWFKFNDETVTEVDEDEIKNNNWLGERSGYSWSSSTYQRSATPYMLVYRRQMHPNDTQTVLGEEQAPTNTFCMPQVDNSVIPSPILEYLKTEEQKRDQRRSELEKEAASCTITIWRNRLELARKEVKCDRSITLQSLLQETIQLVENESTQKFYYRFRRIANRKNQTRRPMELYKPVDYGKSLVDLGLDKRNNIYLEQDTDENFSGLMDCDDEHIILSLRYFDVDLRKPVSVRDFIIPRTTTLGEFKKFLSENNYVPLQPPQMQIVEEETESIINILHGDALPLSKFSVVSGDVLHVEPLARNQRSFVESYYQEKQNEFLLHIVETSSSLKRRMKKVSEKELQVSTLPVSEEWRCSKIDFKLISNKSHAFETLKTIISYRLGISPTRFRLYATSGTTADRLLKSGGKVADVLQKRQSNMPKQLSVELLDHDEELKKGDKLLKVRLHNAKSDFEGVIEVKISKFAKIRDLKHLLKDRTGVNEDNQAITEWFQERFFKIFNNENETIKEANIRPKTDILRMDPVPDPSLNINDPNKNDSVIVLQLVQYISWEQTYARKEMQTTFPALLVLSKSATLFDLRLEISNRSGIPYWNVNIAYNQSFPIYDHVSGIGEFTKQYGDPHLVKEDAFNPDADPDTITDEEEKIRLLATRENRDNRTFNFKAEKTVVLKSIAGWRNLEVICYEDLRNKKNQTDPTQVRGTVVKGKNMDAQALKINN